MCYVALYYHFAWKYIMYTSFWYLTRRHDKENAAKCSILIHDACFSLTIHIIILGISSMVFANDHFTYVSTEPLQNPSQQREKWRKIERKHILWDKGFLFFLLNKMSWEEAENFYDSVMAKIWYSLAHKSKSLKLQKPQFWTEQLRARQNVILFIGSTKVFCFSSCNTGIRSALQVPGMSGIPTCVYFLKHRVKCN